ncbi:MAG: hypothetical protein II953_06290 [Clostridia bacterium]|nr:hypothetical protein [Clostridia bacterium]
MCLLLSESLCFGCASGYGSLCGVGVSMGPAYRGLSVFLGMVRSHYTTAAGG